MQGTAYEAKTPQALMTSVLLMVGHVKNTTKLKAHLIEVLGAFFSRPSFVIAIYLIICAYALEPKMPL
jgi:hypothetical protein